MLKNCECHVLEKKIVLQRTQSDLQRLNDGFGAPMLPHAETVKHFLTS